MEVRNWLRQQSNDFYAEDFDVLAKRWDKCINVGGGYVEKYFYQVRISRFMFYIHLWPIYWLPLVYIYIERDNGAFHILELLYENKQTNSVVLVHKRTIPTEQPQPVGEVSANYSW
jgi:hypothetical protein